MILGMNKIMTEEIWKPIPGFPGYEVSDMGRVRSFKWNDVRILRPATNPKGYLGVLLSNQNKKSFLRIHQLVMLAFVGPRPAGLEVCHGPGGQANNRLENLRYDTNLANLAERTCKNCKDCQIKLDETNRIKQQDRLCKNCKLTRYLT